MSGRYANGFDWLPTTTNSNTVLALLEQEGWYANAGNGGMTVVAPGRWGAGKRLHMSSFSAGGGWFLMNRPIGGHNAAGGYLSAGFDFGATFSGYYPVLAVFDAVNNSVLASVCFQQNGIVAGFRGLGGAGGGTFLGASDPGAFDMSTDVDVEVFFKVDGSAGEIEVRIDTISVLHLINVNTQPGANAYFDSIAWGWVAVNNAPVGVDYYFDDFRYYDTAGTINNAFLGTSRVQTSFPASNGVTTNFSSSNIGLANWQNIRNFNIDDSLYLYDPTIGDLNLSGVDALVNAPTVFFVQVTGFYRQDDATQMYVKNRISSGGVTSDGARFPTTQTYSADTDVFELNPATGLSFTGAQVNALQIGPLITS